MKQFNMKQTFGMDQGKNRYQFSKSPFAQSFRFKYWIAIILAIVVFSSLGGCANCPPYGCSLWS